MLALMSYFGTGVIKGRYFGVKIPPANLQPSYVRESQAFAGELADSMGCANESSAHSRTARTGEARRKGA